MATTESRQIRSLTAPAQIPGRTYRRHRGPNWALIAIAAVILAALVFLAVRATTAGSAQEDYVTETVTPLVDRSNELGDELAQLVARPEDNQDSDELMKRLEEWQADSEQLLEDAEAVEPPGEFRTANGQLVAVFSLRASGFADYLQSVELATEGKQDDAVGVVLEILLEANRDFLASDRLYAHFANTVEDVLVADGQADVEVPKSVYFAAPAAASEPATEQFAAALVGSDAVVGTHDVSLVSVGLDPQPTSFEGDVQTIVSQGKGLEVSVTVKNNGDKTEDSIGVTVVLRKYGGGQDSVQRGSAEVNDLEPGASETVTITGLDPEPGRNQLSVTVGPLPDETEEADNADRIDIDWQI